MNVITPENQGGFYFGYDPSGNLRGAKQTFGSNGLDYQFFDTPFGTETNPFMFGQAPGGEYTGKRIEDSNRNVYGINPATGQYERLSLSYGIDKNGAGSQNRFGIDQDYGVRPYYYLASNKPSNASLEDLTMHSAGQNGLMGAVNTLGSIAVPAMIALATGGIGAAGGLGAGAAGALGGGTAGYVTSGGDPKAALLGAATGGAAGYAAPGMFDFANGGSAAAGGSASGGGLGGGAAASGGTEGSLGGGMWDWLDSIDGGDYFGLQPEAGGGDVLDMFGSTANTPGFSMDPATYGGSGDVLDMFGSTPGNPGFTTAPDAWNPALNITDVNSPGILDILKKYGGDAIKGLVGSGGGAGGGTAPGIPGPFGNSIGNAAFDSTPFLLALATANQQSGDLNGVLNQINGAAYQKSVLDPYDLQTAYQRGALQQDQGLRGIAGSSFANSDLNNFDYTHGLERSDMASKAALASAGLQGQLINSRNTNTNMLLGAGLNASAKLFSPTTDPFNLALLKQLTGH